VHALLQVGSHRGRVSTAASITPGDNAAAFHERSKSNFVHKDPLNSDAVRKRCFDVHWQCC